MSEFEDTLSYVNIPVLNHIQDKVSTFNQETKPHGANEGRQRDRGSQQENPCLGRRSLIDVFDKLRSMNVRNILRLHVEERDPGVPAHAGAAIERAIRGQERLKKVECGNEAIKVELWYVVLHSVPAKKYLRHGNVLTMSQGLEKTRPEYRCHWLCCARGSEHQPILEWKRDRTHSVGLCRGNPASVSKFKAGVEESHSSRISGVFVFSLSSLKLLREYPHMRFRAAAGLIILVLSLGY